PGAGRPPRQCPAPPLGVALGGGGGLHQPPVRPSPRGDLGGERDEERRQETRRLVRGVRPAAAPWPGTERPLAPAARELGGCRFDPVRPWRGAVSCDVDPAGSSAPGRRGMM